MSRNLTAVVLCEDKQSRTVLYRLLKHHLGFARVNIRPLPAGKGCGSQYVREHFANEVRKQRDRAVASVLIVHIDADNLSVTQRKQELAAALARSGEPSRQQDEPIALVVPRWEMESWLHHYLGAPDIVETRSYPKFREDEARAAMPTVLALADLLEGRGTAPVNLPSIAETVLELRRLS